MHTLPPPSTQHQALYQSILTQAAADGSALMGRLVLAAIRDLHARANVAKTRYERDTLANQGSLLQNKDAHLRALYPKALLQAFTNPNLRKKAAPLPMAAVNFEQLELMDEHQVHESVAVAHAQQAALQAADSSLADLNTLICAAQGLHSVRPESNPLRTEAYVSALKTVMDQIDVPDPIRLGWLASMSAALGPELHALYQTLSNSLRQQGVVAVGYTVAQTPASTTRTSQIHHGSAPANTPPPHQETSASTPAPMSRRPHDADTPLLTLDKLRSLLAGELDAPPPANRLQSFSQQFDRQFGNHPTLAVASEFASTMPAALEALADMQQIDQVVQRLEHRRSGQTKNGNSGSADDDSPIEAIRDVLRRSATSVAQGLSLEVVTLMVDNIVRNPRLLKPIQQLIAELEPALLLLSLVDPRFFTDKTHPARELLQEITDRSLAYESEQTSGFAEFLADLQQAVEPLNNGTIENAEPFEQVLAELRTDWQRSARDKQNDRDEAVRALQHAEQRNLLATHIAQEIEQHPGAPDVPPVVLDFLCGPWAQVVAQARLAESADARTAKKYQALIADLLWSANPALTRNNIAKLTRLVPLLLSVLREGLNTIHYPTTKASAFLAVLVGLHQQAFRGINKQVAEPQAAPVPAVPTPAPHEELAVREDDPWVAPAEAKASNFMEWTELPTPSPAPEPTIAPAIQEEIDTWPLGTWVELLVNERWIRTQLTWASQQGSLFLFTSASGTTQSMTRRSRDKLIQSDRLRLATTQTVVDGALDAVASIAMRNSVDTTF